MKTVKERTSSVQMNPYGIQPELEGIRTFIMKFINGLISLSSVNNEQGVFPLGAHWSHGEQTITYTDDTLKAKKSRE
jgi:hypothetical protein